MINNSLFRLQEIPKYNPVSQHYDRLAFWKENKKRCIEGYWVGGKWMPGPLYFYINFFNIQFEDPKSVAQGLGLPFLRDIDWELFLIYEECRGFSGFTGDTLHTCHRWYGPDKKLALDLGWITEEETKTKIYVPARDYLRKIHPGNLGKPLYGNSAKNLISTQSRGSGKSYSSSSLTLHNFLFSGATDYDDYLERLKNNTPLASDTIVGAIDTKYTIPLLKKVKTGYDYLPGAAKFGGLDYPSPLAISYTGSLAPNREIQTPNQSVLRHRTFRDNPFAANGTRPNLVALDEVGFHENIKESWGAIEATQTSKSKKNLVIWALGTGGFVGGKAALYIQDMFNNPQDYNALEFEDIWENRPQIGYFVPYTHTMNHHKKTENYITDLESATKEINYRREKASKAADLTVYYTEIINGPIKPSECFLSISGNMFPTLELQELLAELEGNKIYKDAEYKGQLIHDVDTKEIVWRNDPKARPIYNFPISKNDDKTGCIVIFNHPVRNDEGQIIWGRYLISCDPYSFDQSTTDSLGSTFVYDRYTSKIVAEYTGRPETYKEYYENVYKLCVYYNARVLYENEKKDIFEYFEYKGALNYLTPQPKIIKDFLPDSKVSRGYGIHMPEQLKLQGERMLKAWLLEPNKDGSSNLQHIRSIGLVKELINYNPDINADRVMSMIVMMYHIAEMRKLDVEERNDEVKKGFLNSGFFTKSYTNTTKRIRY